MDVILVKNYEDKYLDSFQSDHNKDFKKQFPYFTYNFYVLLEKMWLGQDVSTFNF